MFVFNDFYILFVLGSRDRAPRRAGAPSLLTDYVDALSRAGDSLFHSLLYAAIGATLLTLLGFFCGYLIHTHALRAWRWVDFLTLLLLVLPAPVIGMGLISLWNRPATDWIYGTPVMILLGYLAQYLALTSRTTAAAIAQIPASMDEAAAVTGAGWFRRLSMITVPLARPGLLAAWLVAYIFCLRDTGIAMLVYPPGHDTLPVRIFTLMANSPEGLGCRSDTDQYLGPNSWGYWVLYSICSPCYDKSIVARPICQETPFLLHVTY